MKINSNKIAIAAFLIAFYLLYGVNFTAVNPLMPLIMDHYDISRRTASLLVSLVFLVQSVAMIPGGMVVARAPVKWTFALGWLTAGAMVLTPVAHTFWILVVLRIIYGIAIAMAMPAASLIVVRVFSRKELPLVNGLNTGFLSVGFSVGSFMTVPLSSIMGWQNSLAVIGATLIVGLGVLLFFRGIPGSIGHNVDRMTIRDMWWAMRSKITFLLGIGDGAALALYVALCTWLPTYYNEIFGMSLMKAGLMVGLISMAGVVGTAAGSAISSLTGVRRPFFIFSGVVVGVFGFGTFLFNNEIIIYVSLIAVGFGAFFYLPVFLTIPMELEWIKERQVPVMTATMFALASGIALVSPIAVGHMTDSMGTYIPAFSVWCVFAFGLLIVSFLLPETGPGRS